MHYLYVTHVSHTYHIRLCELDHDLGSFDVKLRLWLKLYEMFRKTSWNFRALERLREFELNWHTDPAILTLYMQQPILSSGLPLGDLCWLGNYDNLLKVCNVALW